VAARRLVDRADVVAVDLADRAVAGAERQAAVVVAAQAADGAADPVAGAVARAVVVTDVAAAVMAVADRSRTARAQIFSRT